MEVETEKRYGGETMNPMLKRLACQWRKDIEEFDAQVLLLPIVFETHVHDMPWIIILRLE